MQSRLATSTSGVKELRCTHPLLRSSMATRIGRTESEILRSSHGASATMSAVRRTSVDGRAHGAIFNRPDAGTRHSESVAVKQSLGPARQGSASGAVSCAPPPTTSQCASRRCVRGPFSLAICFLRERGADCSAEPHPQPRTGPASGPLKTRPGHSKSPRIRRTPRPNSSTSVPHRARTEEPLGIVQSHLGDVLSGRTCPRWLGAAQVFSAQVLRPVR